MPSSTTRTPATDTLYNTTNGHHQRTSSQQFYNLLYNKFSRLRTCCTTSTTCCELVRWWCPLVVLYNVSVAGVRVAEFGSNRMAIQTPDCSCLAKATSTAMSKSDRLLTTILPHHDLLSSCSTPLLIRPHSARYYILAFRTRQDVDRATGC